MKRSEKGLKDERRISISRTGLRGGTDKLDTELIAGVELRIPMELKREASKKVSSFPRMEI